MSSSFLIVEDISFYYTYAWISLIMSHLCSYKKNQRKFVIQLHTKLYEETILLSEIHSFLSVGMYVRTLKKF